MLNSFFKLIIFYGAVCCLLTSCVKGRVTQNLNQQVKNTHNALNSTKNKSTRNSKAVSLSWEEAWKLMQKQNIGFQISRDALERSREESKKIWKDLLPTLSAFVGLSSQLTTLSNVSSDDINFQVTPGFSIPSPITFYARLYGVRLRQISAEWSHELDKRRAYAELYQAFLNIQESKMRQAELKKLERKLNYLPVENLASHLETLNSLRRVNISTEKQNRLNANRLLNSPGANWDFVGALPQISYRARYQSLILGENFGKLGLKLDAARIEAAQLTVFQIRTRRWPSINFGLSSPALISNRGNAESFSADNLTFFSGSNKSFRLDDPLNQSSVVSAEKRFKFTQARLLQKFENELVQLKASKNQYSNTIHRMTVLKKRQSLLNGSQATDVDLILAEIEESKQLSNQLDNLEKQLSRLDLQFLIWDDTFWNE